MSPIGSVDRMSFSEYRDRRFLPALDALRGISVLLVITCHVHIGSWRWVGGEKGVTVFFILSGYLITFLALREERETGSLSLAAFYIRRSFRIFPLYYLILSLYVLIILVLHARPDKYANLSAALPYYLLYIQEYPAFYGVNGEHENIAFFQSWSLGIEEKFYLVWPILIFVFFRSKKYFRMPICIAMLLLCIAAPSVFGRPAGSMIFPYFNILCGCWLALSLDNQRLYDSVRVLATRWALLSLAAILLVFQFLWPIFEVFPYDYPIDIAYTFCATAFIGAVILSGPVADHLLARRSLLLIGRLSYGMYLVHVLCLNAVEAVAKRFLGNVPVGLAPLLIMIAVVGVTIVVSWVFSNTVERPLIAVGRRLSAGVLYKEKRSLHAA
jgi:peptidoglycan/LPS O-acetylase OafA/YrhL